jgi:hypothetical protein
MGIESEIKRQLGIIMEVECGTETTDVSTQRSLRIFNLCMHLLYTNKLYSKILHPVTDEVTMLQTSNTRSNTLSRSSNTRS